MIKTKTYNQIREDFYIKLRKKVIPTVLKYENERKKDLKLAILQALKLLIISVILFIIPHPFFTFLGLYFFVFVFKVPSVIKKEFENKIKKIIMPEIASCFDNISWKEGGTLDGHIYEFVQIVPQHDIWSNDDVFTGTHNGVNFEISETTLLTEAIPQHKNKRGQEVEAKYTKVFNGIIIKFDMNKNFTGQTLIKPNTLFHLSPQEYLQRTVLEGVDFEKKYDVFTTDEVEARYVITPSFMERLNRIKLAFKVKDLSCAFYGNNLFIALPTKRDVFSICDLNKTLKDEQQYFKMYNEILSIIKLIDHFKLDQKIGL